MTSTTRTRRKRRRLLASLVAVPTLAALAACTSGSGATHQTNGPVLQNTSPTAKGSLSSLTWDLPFGEPTTLDYAQSADYSPDTVVSNLCESLLRLNPDFTVSPNLATAWAYSPDHLSETFTLRSDVVFWDGHSLTSADVVYSMLRNLNPSINPVNGAYYANVKAIVASGPNQVTVHFTHPDELFTKEMATIAGDVVEQAYAKAKGSTFGTAQGGVMCSGPFELGAWHSGSDIVLTANPHYWNPAVKPFASQVTVKFISDTSILTTALKSGEIDGAFEVPAAALPALQSSSAGKVYFGPSLAILELAPNTPGPGADPKIREALGMVIDRTALAHVIFHDGATPNYTLIPKPTGWDPAGLEIYQKAWDALPKPLSPQVSAAKQVLAGDPNASLPITLGLGAGDQTELNTATLIQQEAAQIGLHIVIRQVQPLQFSSAFFNAADRKGLDFLVTAGYLDVRDPLDYLGLFVFPSSIFNWTGYNDPALQADVQKAQSTFDDTQRAQLLTQAQAIYEKVHLVVPLLNYREVVFMKKGITGATTSFAYIYEPNLATVGSAR
jgi:peptide/nickel transport system substrate-binding protein